MTRIAIWEKFCAHNEIYSGGVPLFDGTSFRLPVKTMRLSDGRRVLKRSASMEEMIRAKVQKVREDFCSGRNRYDGILYLMFWKHGKDRVVPLYIGKTATIGKTPGVLSKNLDDKRFARWGDGKAYHIGGLSRSVTQKRRRDRKRQRLSKYDRWSEKLFVTETATRFPTLVKPVYFWCSEWKVNGKPIWPALGSVGLLAQEALLIALAKTCFPNDLLNS